MKEEDYPLSVGFLLELWEKAKKEVKEELHKEEGCEGVKT